MNIEMNKYPKIGQLRDVLYEAKRRASFCGLDGDGEPVFVQPPSLPVLQFTGTVKLHGTNAAIRFDWDSDKEEYIQGYQSRNRIISVDDDNMGFAKWCDERDLTWLLDECLQMTNNDDPKSMVIFGEFCGSNIQSNVALTGLPKMFVVFGLQVDGEWVVIENLESNDDLIYSIMDFYTYAVTVDCNQPEIAQNEIIKLVDQVEGLCPVAHELGVDGIGEGIVWKCITMGFTDLMFKSKGEKHSKTKVKTLNPVDAERIGKVRAFAESVMTESRLEQGIDYLKECNMQINVKSIGVFLKYVVSDCMKEEKVSMIESDIEPKEVGKYLSEVAKQWFFRVGMNKSL